MAVEFQVADRGQDLRVGRDALAHQFGRDAAALTVVLADKAQPLAVRQVGVERDDRDALLGEQVDLILDGDVGYGADGDALYAVRDQLVEQLDHLARDVGLALREHDLDVKVGQLSACGLYAAQHLAPEVVVLPVGQDDTQPDGRKTRFVQGLLMGVTGGDIAEFLHGG